MPPHHSYLSASAGPHHHPIQIDQKISQGPLAALLAPVPNCHRNQWPSANKKLLRSCQLPAQWGM